MSSLSDEDQHTTGRNLELIVRPLQTAPQLGAAVKTKVTPKET